MNANIIKVEGINGIVYLYTDDTFTLAICEDVDSETGDPTNLFESTSKDLLVALGKAACEKLAAETRDSNERSKLERALENETTFVKHFPDREAAIEWLQESGNADRYYLVPGPGDGWSVTDLGTALDLGLGYETVESEAA